MAKGPAAPWGPGAALITVVLVVLASLCVGVFVYGICVLIFRFTEAVDQSLAAVAAALITQLMAAFLIWRIAGIRGRDRNTILSLGLAKVGLFEWAGVLISFLAFTLLLSFSVYSLFPFELREYVPEVTQVAQSGLAGYLLVLLVHVLGAPISEEFLIRGFLFPSLASTSLGQAGALIVTSMLWTALHAGHPVQALFVVFVIGVALGAVLIRTGSLWVCTSCHASYNLMAFAFVPGPSTLWN